MRIRRRIAGISLGGASAGGVLCTLHPPRFGVFPDMRIGSTLLVLMLLSLAPGAVQAQGIDCPDVNFTTDVGSRIITLRWQDPPLEARTKVEISLRKID